MTDDLDQLVAELIDRTACAAASSALEGDALVALCENIAMRKWGSVAVEIASRVARERLGRSDEKSAKIVFEEIALAASQRALTKRHEKD